MRIPGQNLRYAVRTLRRSPGFAVLPILTLGLGIGANVAIFSIVDAVLFRPLAVRDPASLVRIYATNDKGMDFWNSSYPASYAIAAAILAAAILAASAVPAERAARVDPMTALRSE